MNGFRSTCFHCGFTWSSPSYLVTTPDDMTYCPDHTPEALAAGKRRDNPEYFAFQETDNERKAN